METALRFAIRNVISYSYIEVNTRLAVADQIIVLISFVINFHSLARKDDFLSCSIVFDLSCNLLFRSQFTISTSFDDIA
jgi:hypothetical protein